MSIVGIRTSVPESQPAANTSEDREKVSREVHIAPPRYRNEIGKFSVRRDSQCTACG